MFTIELEEEVFSTYEYKNRPKSGSLMFECLDCRMQQLDFMHKVHEVFELHPTFSRSQGVDMTDFCKTQNKSVLIGNIKNKQIDKNQRGTKSKSL